MYPRILVPLDGSETARLGLSEALAFAAGRRTTLCLLHVMNDFPLMLEMADVMEFDRHRHELRAQGQKALDEAGRLCAERGIAVETRLCEMRGGRVAEVIVQQARNLGCDLIVIGTHGRRGVRRVLLGSDAENVLRQSPVPVLLVRAANPVVAARPARLPINPPKYRSILVPVDGSPTSTRGLDEAIRLARQSGGRLRVLHVVDELSMAGALDSDLTTSADWLGRLREGGARLLLQASERVRAAGVAVDSVLADSFVERVADVVAAQAREWPADVIVLGTHGRRGLSRLLLGSDAEQMLRRSPVPMLLVRSAEPDADADAPVPLAAEERVG